MIYFDDFLSAKYFLNQELPIPICCRKAALMVRRFLKSKLRLGLEKEHKLNDISTYVDQAPAQAGGGMGQVGDGR